MNTEINMEAFGATVAALLVIGSILKNAFPSFPNNKIPLLTWVLGVLAYLSMTGGWSEPVQWVAAITAAAAATGAHSAVKNTFQTEPTTSNPTPTK